MQRAIRLAEVAAAEFPYRNDLQQAAQMLREADVDFLTYALVHRFLREPSRGPNMLV